MNKNSRHSHHVYTSCAQNQSKSRQYIPGQNYFAFCLPFVDTCAILEPEAASRLIMDSACTDARTTGREGGLLSHGREAAEAGL